MINPVIIKNQFKIILEKGLGLDISDPNLKDTPDRIARMYMEMFNGIDSDFEDVTTFPNTEKYTGAILLDNISFVSMCSHHFLPFYGKAYIAYIPDKLLIGASKASRIINHYSARPQLQENLCQQVADCFERHVKPKGLFVHMRAIHGCMKCRGVKQADSTLQTTVLKGVYLEDNKARNEIVQYVSSLIQN